MTRGRAIQLAALGFALALLIALLARLGPRAVLSPLASVGAGATWLLVAYTAGTAIGALPWFVLLRRADRPSLGAAIASRFAASGANAIVPFLGIGGEPIRLLWLPPAHRPAGIAALIADRLSYTVASGLFLIGGAFAALHVASLPASYAELAAAGAVALVVIALVTGWLAVRGRIATRIHRLVLKLRKRGEPDGPTYGQTIDSELDAILARRRRVAQAIVLGLCARIVLGAEVYAGFRVLGVELSAPMAIVFASVPVVLAFVGAIVPSQLGIQEGSQALVATALGISPSTAVAVVLLQRARVLVTGGLAWLLVVARRVHTSHADAPSCVGATDAHAHTVRTIARR